MLSLAHCRCQNTYEQLLEAYEEQSLLEPVSDGERMYRDKILKLCALILEEI